MPIKLMRTETRALGRFLVVAVAVAFFGTVHAAEEEKGGGLGSDWKTSHAGTDVDNKASLQRGARNFANYCLGCHSLKYERYSRLGQDLEIAPDLLEKYLIPPGEKPA